MQTIYGRDLKGLLLEMTDFHLPLFLAVGQPHGANKKRIFRCEIFKRMILIDTGYIPRSKEHFGHSYVETTSQSLAEFQRMMATKDQLPSRVQKIQKEYQPLRPEFTNVTDGSKQKNFNHWSSPRIENTPPSRLPGRDNAPRTFPSGYTGYV